MYGFLTDCVASDGESITRMKDAAKEISYVEFAEWVNPEQLAKFNLSYYGEGSDLDLGTDEGMSFYQSHYQGQPCVYFVHSGIEHIFTRLGSNDIESCYLIQAVTKRSPTRVGFVRASEFLKGKWSL